MPSKPIGVITRGTTNPNRLRRVDRYLANQPVLRKNLTPLVIDLGFGANPTTSIELYDRLKKVNAEVRVLGIEIDRERVSKAKLFETKDLLFTLGGFEIPIPEQFGNQATLIRAMNVLRQYDQSEVTSAWKLMQQKLTTNGLIIEGTCDEIGRLASWVTLTKSGPFSLTLSFRLIELIQPSSIAERLPKVLIHKNTPGNKIHQFLTELDRAWLNNSSLSVFSAVQRFTACAEELLRAGWPIKYDPKRWKLGELTIDWQAVSPS